MSNKTILHRVFNELLEEITPQSLIVESCHLDGTNFTVMDKRYDLDAYKNVYLLGSGKAVVPMAEEIGKLLKPYIRKSLIIGPYDTAMKPVNGEYIQGSHPLPTQKSITAAKAMQEMLQNIGEEDLFIYLLSGGTSALLELPEDEITLNEFQEVTKQMLHSGMPIDKINCVRKHISQVKGGKLSGLTKGKGVVLVLSDVVGDDLHAIGSAPMYCDTTSFKDAEDALYTYGLFNKIPKSVKTFISEGMAKKHAETPKMPSEYIDHHILGSNSKVLQKAAHLLEKEGIESSIIKEPLQGNITQLTKKLLEFSACHQESTQAYIFGGEATVNVKGEGKGGRNQHLCLSMLTLFDGSCDITFLSAATDGVDGNSDAAGALVDTHSLVHAKAHHIDPVHYLESFDSNSFFALTGELLITGPTHNNLLDIIIMLIEPNPTQRVNNG